MECGKAVNGALLDDSNAFNTESAKAWENPVRYGGVTRDGYLPTKYV